MNTEQLKGNWKQLKGEVLKRWGQLTHDDYDVIEGEKEKLVGKLIERYGLAKEEAEKQVEEFNISIH
jgi:uncharacterized protein YjbJ (UPF0337 family)